MIESEEVVDGLRTVGLRIGQCFLHPIKPQTNVGLIAAAERGRRAENLARARELLMPPIIPVDAIKAINPHPAEPEKPTHSCPCCGGRMIIIERFQRGTTPHYRPSPPTPAIRIDAS